MTLLDDIAANLARPLRPTWVDKTYVIVMTACYLALLTIGAIALFEWII